MLNSKENDILSVALRTIICISNNLFYKLSSL